MLIPIVGLLAVVGGGMAADSASASNFDLRDLVATNQMLTRAGLVDTHRMVEVEQSGELAEFSTKVMHFDLYLSEMLRDENWTEWMAFQKSGTTIIPVASAQIYVRYSVNASRAPKPKYRMVTSGDMPPVPKALRFLFPQIGEEGRIGLLEMGVDELASRWNPYRWLFEEQGIILEKEWSWESVLPRVALVVGVLITILVLVELLRIMAIIGSKAVGGVQRFVTGKRRGDKKNRTPAEA